MVMPRSAIVQTGFDGAEQKLPARSRQELAEAAEIRIGGRIPRGVCRVKVIACIVRVPQFNERSTNGRPTARQHSTAQVGDYSGGDGKIVVQLREVVVFVQWHVRRQRIIGSLR